MQMLWTPAPYRAVELSLHMATGQLRFLPYKSQGSTRPTLIYPTVSAADAAKELEAYIEQETREAIEKHWRKLPGIIKEINSQATRGIRERRTLVCMGKYFGIHCESSDRIIPLPL